MSPGDSSQLKPEDQEVGNGEIRFSFVMPVVAPSKVSQWAMALVQAAENS